MQTRIISADYRISSTFTVKDQKITGRTTGRKTLTFNLSSVPAGNTISSAYIQATYEQPTGWPSTLRLNDTIVPKTRGKTTLQTPVTIPSGAASVDVEVTFVTDGDASASAGLHTDTIMVTGVELVVESESSVAKCGAPTSGSLAKTEVTSLDAVRVSWEGATAGAGSTITGYSLQRSQSIDNGQHWSEWEGVITADRTYHDTNPGPEGTWRRYRVRANSSAGDAYNSDWYNIPGTLHHAGTFDDGTQPHNNMPPYRVVHIWRRKA